MANKRTETSKSIVKASAVHEKGVCDLCCHETKDWVLGQCDHPTCLRCSTKLRLLCGQKECPVCREPLKKVLSVYLVKPYASFSNVSSWRCDKRNGVFFQNQNLQNAYFSLMENKCTKCSEPPFRTFKLLRDHMSKTHNLFYCDICTDNLKLFPSEFKAYTRKDLVQHRREGDKDDTSHKGHPLCQFCDERYLDNDQLHAHLHKNHFWCHFCESDGKQDYFSDYPSLRRHFRAEHFLCEEAQCRNEKFTSVFRSKLDLQAHRASAHTKGLSKAEVKQLKQLDVGFTYSREREEEEMAANRRSRHTGRAGESASRGARSAYGRTREQLDDTRPKPANGPRSLPKKSSPPSPPKISPMEETKAPPGFVSQPLASTNTALVPTSFALISGVQGYDGGRMFDPYRGICVQETVHPVLVANTGLNPGLVPLPPPGFNFPTNTSSTQPQQKPLEETEWPDLTGSCVTDPSVYPSRVSEPPVLGNISAAVMNANKQPDLMSQSSFPSLVSGVEPITITSLAGNMMSHDIQCLDAEPPPPPSASQQESKLLKLAVAATSSNSSSSSSGSYSSGSTLSYHTAATQLDSFDLSPENFPPMVTSAPVIISGGHNQNNNPSVEKVISSSTMEVSSKRSKQSQILERVRKALGYDAEKFTHFKTLMGWYKNGEIKVEEFKVQCHMLFGTKWKDFGPELAEMMPSQEKKNELLSSFGIRLAGRKNHMMTTTTSSKSRRRAPVVTTSSTSGWGPGPRSVGPVCNFNTMSTGLSHDDYPTLGSTTMNQRKTPTPWNVVIQ